MAVVFEKPKSLTDAPLHYCPGCTHGIVHRLVAEAIDDLGIERSSEFALEQVFNVIDSRYRSKKPLIVTTNLTLDELKHPKDLARAIIYDRVLERCVPLNINNQNIRELNAAANMQEARKILNSGT